MIFILEMHLGSPGRMFIQNKNGTFRIKEGPWEQDSLFEATRDVYSLMLIMMEILIYLFQAEDMNSRKIQKVILTVFI